MCLRFTTKQDWRHILQDVPAASTFKANISFQNLDDRLRSRNAVLRVFPDVDVKGCFLNLAQCAYCKVQANGLQQKYIEDEQFNLDIKMIPALASVPEDAVEEAFESLADNISADAQPILDYFEDTFIGRPTDEVLSSAFIFGICMTVQYKNFLAPTTT